MQEEVDELKKKYDSVLNNMKINDLQKFLNEIQTNKDSLIKIKSKVGIDKKIEELGHIENVIYNQIQFIQ